MSWCYSNYLLIYQFVNLYRLFGVSSHETRRTTNSWICEIMSKARFHKQCWLDCCKRHLSLDIHQRSSQRKQVIPKQTSKGTTRDLSNWKKNLRISPHHFRTYSVTSINFIWTSRFVCVRDWLCHFQSYLLLVYFIANHRLRSVLCLSSGWLFSLCNIRLLALYT